MSTRPSPCRRRLGRDGDGLDVGLRGPRGAQKPGIAVDVASRRLGVGSATR